MDEDYLEAKKIRLVIDSVNTEMTEQFQIKRQRISAMVMLVLPGVLWVLVSLPAVAALPNDDNPFVQAHMKRYAVKADFSEVMEDVEMAITEQGLVINNISHIGNMLERTRKAAGSSKRLFLEAKAVEFCSATVSRQMMEADPHNIVFCPYIIFVYVLPEQPDIVYLAYRRPIPVGSDESRNSLNAVELLLDEIIHAVVD